MCEPQLPAARNELRREKTVCDLPFNPTGSDHIDDTQLMADVAAGTVGSDAWSGDNSAYYAKLMKWKMMASARVVSAPDALSGRRLTATCICNIPSIHPF